MAGLGCGLIAAATSGSVGAVARAPLFDRATRPLGLQLYTLGTEFARDDEGLFARLAALGYRRFQCDLPRLEQPAFRAAAARHGLTAPSVHLDPVAFRPDAADGDGSAFERLADRIALTGAVHAGPSIFPFPLTALANLREPFAAAIARLSAAMSVDDWKRIADLLNRRGAVLKRRGVRLFYHNHNLEFRPVENTTPLHLLIENTDPGLVDFELDAGWVVAAGHDPIALLRRHHGRFRLMHVKDVGRATVPNFAMEQVSAPVGEGMIRWDKLIPAARRAGVDQFYVEQEPPFTGPRIDSAAASARFLLGEARPVS